MTKRYCIIIICMIAHILFGQDTGARYLIITPDEYVPYLEPLAQWKTQKGMKAKIAALSETGSDSSEIKSYIANAYNTWQPRPEYVLFVGSKYQIPFPYFQVLGYAVSSDNYYVNVTGDFRNDMIPGRFWVHDSSELKTVVAKVLGYERDPYIAEPQWFRKGVTIVVEEWWQPSSDSVYWGDARFLHQHMLEADFLHIDSFSYYYGHTNEDVIDAINDGRSYIMYRGDGFAHWCAPFYPILPEHLFNGYKLPIVLSGTCATIEGIGQLWQCAGTPTEPKGVVGFFGTTTALGAAAEMRSALVRGTISHIFNDKYPRLGIAAEAGRLNYYNLFGNELEYNSWNCLGDPEMILWTNTPHTIEVEHADELFAGLCTLSVVVEYNAAPVESALVCVRALQESTFYHYSYTDQTGTFVIEDSINTPGDSIIITVTGKNCFPYTGLIRVLYPDAPYVLLHRFYLVDHPAGNNDSIPNPGEQLEIPFWLKNWGEVTAYNVSAVLRETVPDEYIALNDTIKYVGDIGSLDSVYSSDNGFNILISPECPDSHIVNLTVKVSDIYGYEWTSTLLFPVHAPVLNILDYYYQDGIRHTDPGDTVELYAELYNTGSYPAENIIGRVFSTDSFYIPVDSFGSFSTIMPLDTGNNQIDPFIMATDPSTPVFYPLEVCLEITAGVYIDTFVFTLCIGQQDIFVWDPDLNHTSGPFILSILDSLDFSAEYSVNFPVDSSYLYRSIFICCGVYPNNYIIRDTSRTALEIVDYLQIQNGKVYLEGGDVWVGDPQQFHGYDFCPLFDIEPLNNSTGPFPAIIGQAGTFTQGMEFLYQGEVTWLDYIDSIAGSSLIFRNTYNDHGCGVAANNRTVGLSFELGCLIDTMPPSTKYILLDSIMDYFGIVPTGIAEYQTSEPIISPYMHIAPIPSRHTVRFSLYGVCTSTPSSIYIYDICGRLVKEFRVPASTSQPVTVLWDGKDNCGRSVAQGVYMTILCTRDHTVKEKIILLK
jgi:hypothetical protein